MSSLSGAYPPPSPREAVVIPASGVFPGSSKRGSTGTSVSRAERGFPLLPHSTLPPPPGFQGIQTLNEVPPSTPLVLPPARLKRRLPDPGQELPSELKGINRNRKESPVPHGGGAILGTAGYLPIFTGSTLCRFQQICGYPRNLSRYEVTDLVPTLDYQGGQDRDRGSQDGLPEGRRIARESGLAVGEPRLEARAPCPRA
jgi:hypothetical protein